MLVYLVEEGEYDDRATTHVASTLDLGVAFLQTRAARLSMSIRIEPDDDGGVEATTGNHSFGSVRPMEVDEVR